MRKWQSLATQYAFAAVMVLAALAAIETVGESRAGYASLFCAAVAASAWFGGLGPGLLATLLAGTASAYFFIQPTRSFNVGLDDFIRISSFTFVAILISYLHETSRRSQEHSQRATEEATRANRAKDRFLAVLSHELRNPLDPVLAISSLMEADENLPPQAREDAATIHRNVELEIRLIDDLLDLSRITAGKLEIKPQAVDVHDVIHDVVGMCRNDAHGKNQRLVMHLAAGEHWAHADPVRLRQVLWNLAKNAIKFTPAGGTVSVSSADEPDGRLRLDVSDTGVGIEPGMLIRIFDPFEQGDQGVTRKFGGLGLGLAISKRLAEAQGGTLTAASPGKGRGATFSLRLTAIPAPPPVAAPATPRDSNQAVAPLTVLLVEDHRDSRAAMARILKRGAQEVLTAEGFAEALSVLESRPVDLLISDLSLPDGSGLDLARRLRQISGAYAVSLSGHGSEEAIAASREAGFEEHLVKPVAIAQIEDVFRRLQRGGRSNRAGAVAGG